MTIVELGLYLSQSKLPEMLFSRWAEPTDYRFRLRVFFFDTNLQIAS